MIELNKKEHWVGVRVTDEERDAIRAMAKILNVSVSEMIRMSLNKLMECN